MIVMKFLASKCIYISLIKNIVKCMKGIFIKLQLKIIHDCICFVVASSYDAQTTPNLIQFIEPCMITAKWHTHGVMLLSYWTTNTW